ncbi:MAG TPA: hypothetical protein VKE24_08260 [Candidatus Acidoferrales bacterium]|nr:hypothetical protein [Candidatus Acidoferrales bacterium]
MMKRNVRIAFAVLFVMTLLALSSPLVAQTIPPGGAPGEEKQEKGLTWRERFEGSSSQDGQVMVLNSSFGYNLNKFFGWDVGVPVFFLRQASRTTGTGTNSVNGIGNVYTDLRLNAPNPLLNYSSSITVAAPTGDTTKGLSSGRITVDWDNRVDRSFGQLTPFFDAGVGNSISDTRFFRRPFITLGPVAHFEGGVDIGILKLLTFTASAYDIQPWGTQRVFSRVQTTTTTTTRGRVFETSRETLGTADLTRDHGFTAGLSLSMFKYVALDVGYTRSIRFALDTVSFGIGFDLTPLVRHKPSP